jgi:hypothetical protein
MSVIEARKVKKIDSDAYTSLTFELDSKTRDIKASSTDSFVNSHFPHDLKQISLQFYSDGKANGKKKIWIDLDFSFWGESNFSVEGRDPIWVNGITGQLEDIFKHKQNKNYIFRKKRTRIPIVIAIAFLLALGINSMILAYYPTILDENDDPNELLYIIGTVLGMPLFFFVEWLFPQVEFDDYLIQTRIKKIVFSLFAIIITGLLVSAFSKLLFG